MTERISIFNYEAFYLDFLEGNLNEEDTALLFQFLEKHPELKVDLDEFEGLTFEENTADLTSFKASLKQPDLVADSINNDNFETFAIAALEGQLSANQQQAFEAYVASNPSVAEEWKLTQALVLEPDTTIVFADKEGLKRKKAIVLWPYIAAAASILIAFIIINSGNNKELPVDQQIAVQPKDQTNTTEVVDPAIQPNDVQQNQVATYTNDAGTNNGHNPSSNKINKQPIKAENYQLAMNVAHGYSLPELRNDDEVEQIEITQPQINTNNDFAATAAVADLKSVAKPITSRLSDFTNTPIDVKTAKATNEKPGGFFFKIGKVEVSRVAKK